MWSYKIHFSHKSPWCRAGALTLDSISYMTKSDTVTDTTLVHRWVTVVSFAGHHSKIYQSQIL